MIIRRCYISLRPLGAQGSACIPPNQRSHTPRRTKACSSIALHQKYTVPAQRGTHVKRAIQLPNHTCAIGDGILRIECLTLQKQRRYSLASGYSRKCYGRSPQHFLQCVPTKPPLTRCKGSSVSYVIGLPQINVASIRVVRQCPKYQVVHMPWRRPSCCQLSTWPSRRLSPWLL